jgi:hypothetical protein
MDTYATQTDDATYINGPKNAMTILQQGQAANTRANVSFNSIEAELKIQGDPTFADPIFTVGKTLALLVINPFHVDDSGGGSCGDWTQAETCNAVLSNKNWIIMGSHHEIKEGSYTTIIKVRLPAPGADISVGQPLGADPTGYVISTNCQGGSGG